jgi:sugar phosphate isomerase/epimerase
MKRRNFIYTAAAGSFAILQTKNVFALEADNLYRKNIGIQLYTIRNEIGKDVNVAMKAVADAGYKQVECYGFPGCDPMIKAAKDFGLAVNSSHFYTDSLFSSKDAAMPDLVESLDKANLLGIKYLVISSIPEASRASLDTYKNAAEVMNKAAEIAKKANIQFCYHNHAFEFKPQDHGKCGYDIFMEEFSQDMKFEMDVFWVKVGGREPLDLMKKLKDRVAQLHLKDLKSTAVLPAYGEIPEENYKELGNGIIPMEPILNLAKEIGVDICHVEQDYSLNPIVSIQESAAYLKKL